MKFKGLFTEGYIKEGRNNIKDILSYIEDDDNEAAVWKYLSDELGIDDDEGMADIEDILKGLSKKQLSDLSDEVIF